MKMLTASPWRLRSVVTASAAGDLPQVILVYDYPQLNLTPAPALPDRTDPFRNRHRHSGASLVWWTIIHRRPLPIPEPRACYLARPRGCLGAPGVVSGSAFRPTGQAEKRVTREAAGWGVGLLPTITALANSLRATRGIPAEHRPPHRLTDYKVPIQSPYRDRRGQPASSQS
jgi:hypothetical protein